MTTDEFLTWSERHCRLFAIAFDDDRATVTSWLYEFNRLNFTPEDLNAATSAMVTSTRPVRLSDQLVWITGFVRGRRSPRNAETQELIRSHRETGEFSRKSFREMVEQVFPDMRWTTGPGRKERTRPTKPDVPAARDCGDETVTEDGEVLSPAGLSPQTNSAAEEAVPF